MTLECKQGNKRSFSGTREGVGYGVGPALKSQHHPGHWEAGGSPLGLSTSGSFCEGSLESQSQVLGIVEHVQSQIT